MVNLRHLFIPVIRVKSLRCLANAGTDLGLFREG